jgi:hypothetical protein
VRLLAPAAARKLIAPARLDLEADATADRSIRWVEFQTNQMPLKRLTGPPYKFAWSPIQAGTYVITAVVEDSKGGTARSGSVTVSVASPHPLRGTTWTNSLGMEFLPMPGGGGWLGRFETRLVDYLAFDSSHEGQHMRQASFSHRTNREPVVKVSWRDAGKFCQWLTEREQKSGLLGAQHHYRLPRVNEWRLALGTNATSKPRYTWGPDWPPPPRIGNLRGAEWVRGNDFGVKPLPGYEDGVLYLAPVGIFSPNVHGFYDLIGNVWELCEKRGRTGRLTAVALGGAWNTSDPDELRPSSELAIATESLERDDLGFRCFLADESTKSE